MPTQFGDEPEKRLFLNRLVAYKDKTFGLLSYDETPMLTLERKWTEDKNIVGYRANFTCIPTGTHKIKLEMQTLATSETQYSEVRRTCSDYHLAA